MHKIELHVHTTASDGYYDPGKIVKLAWERGIRCLAITDHDSVAGLKEAHLQTYYFPLELIPGIEFSTNYDNHEIHILGYYIIVDNKELQDTLKMLADSRVNRTAMIVDRLNKNGISITYDEVKSKSSSGGVLGRPHVALAMIDHGIVSTIEEAFKEFLNPGCPGYVSCFKLSPSKAIRLIKTAGGVPVLAHPGTGFTPNLFSLCLKAGLMGIEVFHPRHTPSMEKYFLTLAQEHNLIITGGSDFHGHNAEDWLYFGNMTVPSQTIDILKERAVY